MMEDVDGDGEYEIAAVSDDNLIHMWREDGSIVDGWPVDLGGKPVSVPIAVRSNRPDGASILVCTRSPRGGSVHLLSPEGKPREGWPKILSQIVAAGSYDRRPVWTADLDRDGTLEVICLSTHPAFVHAWYQDGTIFPGYPVSMGEKICLGMAIDNTEEHHWQAH